MTILGRWGAGGVGSGVPLFFDGSEYRQNTYGPPTHYCDPARSLASAGAGTLGDPWNQLQAMSEPVAGNVVGWLSGVGVDLPTTNDDNTPAFRPANSGTVGNRIVHVTRVAAIQLAMNDLGSDITTNSNRTEIRHNGSAPGISGGVGTGTGCAAYGAKDTNYVTYDGFFVDMAEAYMKEDSGVIRPENCTGVEFRNFVVKGTLLTVASNAVIYRPHNAVNTVLSNFYCYDFENDPTGSHTPQAALFSDQYGDRNVLIEHFWIKNTQRGIFFKGTTSGPQFNYGTIRYGICSDVTTCWQFNDLHPTELTTLHHCLGYDVRPGAGLRLSSETTAARNFLAHHLTIARMDSSSLNQHGGIYSRANGIGSNVGIRDSLIVINTGTYGHGCDFWEISGLPSVLDYNGYYKGGSTITQTHNGSQYNTLSAWRSAVNRDLNSLYLSSNPFVDSAGGDFRVAGGHAAKTASSTGGELGCYATTEHIIGPDVRTA